MSNIQYRFDNIPTASKTIASKAAKAIKSLGNQLQKTAIDARAVKSATHRVNGLDIKQIPASQKTSRAKAVRDIYRKRQSVSAKSGLSFPVGRILSKMRKTRLADRVSKVAGVYVSAVMEYMISEIVEQAGGVVKDNKKKFIFPRHIYLAVEGDDEMKKYLGKEVIMPTVGRKIYTHPFLTTQDKIPAKNFCVVTKDLKNIRAYPTSNTSIIQDQVKKIESSEEDN